MIDIPRELIALGYCAVGLGVAGLLLAWIGRGDDYTETLETRLAEAEFERDELLLERDRLRRQISEGSR